MNDEASLALGRSWWGSAREGYSKLVLDTEHAMTAWHLKEAYVSTHLFFAKAKTPTHVAYEAAIALVPFLGIVLTVRQVVVSARHGGAGTGAGRMSVNREIGTIVLLGLQELTELEVEVVGQAPRHRLSAMRVSMGVSDDVAGERTSWNPRRHPINCTYPDFSWSASQSVQGGRMVMACI